MPHQRRNELFSRYLLATTLASRIRPLLAAVASESWSSGPDGTVAVSSPANLHSSCFRVVDDSAYADERTEYIAQVCPANVAALLTLVESVAQEHFGERAWIASAEALPATSAAVLAWDRDEGHKVLRYLSPQDAGDSTQGWYGLDGRPTDAAKVLAWRILPPAFAADTSGASPPPGAPR